jgi:hypothetical protein
MMDEKKTTCPACGKGFLRSFQAPPAWDRKKNRWVISCPFCYSFLQVGRFHDKPEPRDRPHMSKKARLRARRDEKSHA